MAKKMYVIETNKPNGGFVQSAWAGEGYATKREAQEHLKFWKERGMFTDEKLTIGVEDAPPGW